MLLDQKDLSSMASIKSPEQINDFLNARAWAWFAEHADDKVASLWIIKTIRVRDLRPFWCMLFGNPPADEMEL